MSDLPGRGMEGGGRPQPGEGDTARQEGRRSRGRSKRGITAMAQEGGLDTLAISVLLCTFCLDIGNDSTWDMGFRLADVLGLVRILDRKRKTLKVAQTRIHGICV